MPITNLQTSSDWWPEERSEVRRILLPRFDSHGDMILLMGFLDQLVKQYPSAEVTLLVRKGYDQLASLFPQSLTWLTLDCDPRARYAEEELTRIGALLEDVASEPWDLALFTTYSRTFLDDLLAARLTGITRVGLGRPTILTPWQKRVFDHLGLVAADPFSAIIPVNAELHETQKYQQLARHLWGCEAAIDLPQISIPVELQSQASDLLAGFGLREGSYVACMPAGIQNVALKIWPGEWFAETLAWLAQTREMPAILLGHESERELLQSVQTLTEAQGVAVHLWLGRSGEMGLLAALLQGAGLYLGNDSGPMHLAAAAGTPTLGLFGGGTWPRFTAVGHHCLSMKASVPCEGCAWDCPFGSAHCLRALSPQAVRSGISQLLDSPAGGSQVIEVTAALSLDALSVMGQAASSHRHLTAELEKRLHVIDELASAHAAIAAAYSQLTAIDQDHVRADGATQHNNKRSETP